MVARPRGEGVAREQDQTDSIDVLIRASPPGRQPYLASTAASPVSFTSASSLNASAKLGSRNGMVWGPMALHNSYAVRHPVRGMVVNSLLLGALLLLLYGLDAPILTLENLFLQHHHQPVVCAAAARGRGRMGLFVLIGLFSVVFPIVKILLLFLVECRYRTGAQRTAATSDGWRLTASGRCWTCSWSRCWWCQSSWGTCRAHVGVGIRLCRQCRSYHAAVRMDRSACDRPTSGPGYSHHLRGMNTMHVTLVHALRRGLGDR